MVLIFARLPRVSITGLIPQCNRCSILPKANGAFNVFRIK